MQTYLAVMTWIGFALMVGTLLGLMSFIVSYRPFAPWRHGRSGGHLLWMSWALVALYGVSLLGAVVREVPEWLAALVTDLVLGFIFAVVWHRNHLYRDFRRGESDDHYEG